MTVLRAVRRTDLAAVLALNNGAVPAVNRLEPDELAWFVDVAHTFLVVDVDGRLVAFLVGLDGPGVAYDSPNYQWFSEHYARFVYVDRVVVADDQQGAGHGRTLYDAFVDRGRVHGHDLLAAEVNTRPSNDASLRFHRRYGFEVVGQQDTEGGAKTVALLELRFD